MDSFTIHKYHPAITTPLVFFVFNNLLRSYTPEVLTKRIAKGKQLQQIPNPENKHLTKAANENRYYKNPSL